MLYSNWHVRQYRIARQRPGETLVISPPYRFSLRALFVKSSLPRITPGIGLSAKPPLSVGSRSAPPIPHSIRAEEFYPRYLLFITRLYSSGVKSTTFFIPVLLWVSMHLTIPSGVSRALVMPYPWASSSFILSSPSDISPTPSSAGFEQERDNPHDFSEKWIMIASNSHTWRRHCLKFSRLNMSLSYPFSWS